MIEEHPMIDFWTEEAAEERVQELMSNGVGDVRIAKGMFAGEYFYRLVYDRELYAKLLKSNVPIGTTGIHA